MKLLALSVRGAREISSVARWVSDVSDPARQACAKQGILDAASNLGLSDRAFRTTLDQIVKDPIQNSWSTRGVSAAGSKGKSAPIEFSNRCLGPRQIW